MQCRVCMQSKCHILFNMNILGTEDGKNLYECFNECTQLGASADDDLPKTLCKICAEKLHVAYNFRRTAKQSNKELKKLLISVRMETDSVDRTPEELCGLEDMGNSKADPLDMSFHEALRALKESPMPSNRSLEEALVGPLLEFSKENICLEKSTKSPNLSFEEALQEPLLEFPKEIICIEKSTKSPNQLVMETLLRPLGVFATEKLCLETSTKSPNRSLDEAQIEIVREIAPVTVTESQDTSLQQNVKQINEFKIFDSFSKDESESETEPSEKVGYACEICKSTYTIKTDLKNHIADQHKSEVICISCSKVYDMPNELRIHKKLVHETDSPVQCDYCSDKPIIPRTELLKHFQTVHSSRYFRFFPRLRKRRAIDSEDPTAYQCKFCKNTFTTGLDLEEHIRSHIFRCPICLKNFNRYCTYYAHVKRLHNCTSSIFTSLVVDVAEDKPIQCKLCNKSYTRLGSYNKHMKQKHHKITESTYINDIEKTMDNEIVDVLDQHHKITESTDINDLEKTMDNEIVDVLDQHLKIIDINDMEETMDNEVVDILDQHPKITKSTDVNNVEETMDDESVDVLDQHHKITESTDINDVEKTMDNEIVDVLDQHLKIIDINDMEEAMNSEVVDILDEHSKITESTDINTIEETMDNEIVDVVDIQAYKVSIAKTESEESPSLADVTWEAESKEDHFDEIYLKSEQNNVVDQESKESVKKQQKKKKNISQEKKGYLCSFCPRVLCSNVSLRTHEKTQHLDAKNDLLKECPICQKKLNVDYIKKHIRSVHIGERNSVCDICAGTYKCLGTLRRHKLLHMTDRHWQCNACDMKFVEKSALTIHMRLHTGEMPFACHICDRRFRIKTHLTYHLEKHGNIKKKCKVCGKEFACSTTLRKHSFEHTGNMPYKCTDCGYATAVREYITTHTLRKHDRKMTEDELFLMFKTNTGKAPRVKNLEYLKKLTENSKNSDNLN